jgi:hypothetical protein
MRQSKSPLLVGEAWLRSQLSGLSSDVQAALAQPGPEEWNVAAEREEAFAAALLKIAALVRRVPSGHLPPTVHSFIAKQGRTAIERIRMYGFAEGVSEGRSGQ